VQIERARRLVPGGTFLRADATGVAFEERTFDAVVCLYALIHMPLDRQPVLLRRVGGWLRPGGVLLATAGASAWTGTEDGWLGGTVTMWWSQADAATYRTWITEAGLQVESDHFVPEGDGGHQLFWAHRPA
jgi:SAM-dependent methyltransferase